MNFLTIGQRAFGLACMMSLLATSGGCASSVDAAPEDEATATTREAVAGYWSYSWSTTGANHVYDVDLHLTPAQATCFLSGVGGDLSSGVGDGNGYPRDAFAGVIVSGGTWHLITHQYLRIDGANVDAATICLPMPTNLRVTANQILPGPATTWAKGQPSVRLGAVLPNRVCALTSVQNQMFWSNNAWASNNDMVNVWNDGVSWYIGGTGSAQGTAACVDKTIGGGLGIWWSSTSTPNNIVQSIDHGTTPLGTQCFLSGVSGRFRDATPAWDGTFVHYTPSSNWWSVETDNGKGAGVTCLQ